MGGEAVPLSGEAAPLSGGEAPLSEEGVPGSGIPGVLGSWEAFQLPPRPTTGSSTMPGPRAKEQLPRAMPK